MLSRQNCLQLECDLLLNASKKPLFSDLPVYHLPDLTHVSSLIIQILFYRQKKKII